MSRPGPCLVPKTAGAPNLAPGRCLHLLQAHYCYEYCSDHYLLLFILFIIHYYFLLWAEMLLQTQKCPTAHGPLPLHPIPVCQPRATRQDRDRDRHSSLPQLRVPNYGAGSAMCPQKLGRSQGWGVPQRGSPVTSATCPTGLPRCGRRCRRSGVRNTSCSSSRVSTASPSTSWTRMRSGVVGAWTGDSVGDFGSLHAQPWC